MQSCAKKEVALNTVELTLDKSAVFLTPNNSVSVNISTGNGEYTAISSDVKVATASITDNVITIKATSKEDKANAVIVVTDKMFKRQSIDVVISKLFEMTLSKTEASLEVGVPGKNELTVDINTGNGGYKTELVENSSQFVELNTTKLESHAKLTIKAIAAGIAKVKITDAKGKEAMVKLTITAPSTLALSKNDVTLSAVQGREDITVTSGNGDYKVSVANSFIAKAYAKGNVITIKGKVNGSTSVVIEDKKGQKATVNVKVEGAAFAMNLSDQYFGYANFNDIAIVDQTIKSLKQVTFEMTCKIDGYRGLQTFMGLEGNLIIRGKNDDFQPTHPLQIVGLGDKITLESTKSFKLNEWMNIALVVDCSKQDISEKYKLYINGVQDALIVSRQEDTHTSINLASSSDGNRFEIGRAFGQDFRAMKGIVSEARVWTVARTAQQIKDNMCALTAETNTGLLSRWNFTAGAETDYIQDSNGGKYETNLIIANAKLGGNYTPVKAPQSVFVSKGCPN
ncbi:LamG-like jellyroll fold domain-containing protein [Pedobacter sp. UYP30]|uniref:LamG-like jellyroll fold domain-containing protein n=1 Tax=Pedobacter sp. UYP30 TaxID=1756400 RepID=UPI003391ACE3